MTGVAEAQVVAKLQQALGRERAAELVRARLRELGIDSLETVDDRYRFGESLTRDGGLRAAIGRAIVVQAILQGAKAA